MILEFGKLGFGKNVNYLLEFCDKKALRGDSRQKRRSYDVGGLASAFSVSSVGSETTFSPVYKQYIYISFL